MKRIFKHLNKIFSFVPWTFEIKATDDIKGFERDRNNLKQDAAQSPKKILVVEDIEDSFKEFN